MTTSPPSRTDASARQIRRWRKRLADERAEAAVYRDLASRRSGTERDILLQLAEAEKRHEQHWLDLLGDQVGYPKKGALSSRFVGLLARRFGSVFVLALAQRAEQRTPYDVEPDATDQMAADEHIHAEVIRALATQGRLHLAGSFRAAVFGTNDGLVSNLALVLGVGASGVSPATILMTGLAGLLAGALSMGAGEYVSVRSQRELLAASAPAAAADAAVPHLDVDANELMLVYRARGMSEAEAAAKAQEALAVLEPPEPEPAEDPDEYAAIGSAWKAAMYSFVCFASGAIVPVLPYIFGMNGLPAVAVAAGLVGIALLSTGAIVGLLSGTSPLLRGLRQLAIGYGAAAVTYLLGLAFGTQVS